MWNPWKELSRQRKFLGLRTWGQSVLWVLEDRGWSGEGSGAPGEIVREVCGHRLWRALWSLQDFASYSEEFRNPDGGLSRRTTSSYIWKRSFWLLCLYRLWDFPGGPVIKNPPAMQGTQVPSLVWEDHTCHGASEPTSHNYRAPTLESRNLEEKPPSLRSPAQPKLNLRINSGGNVEAERTVRWPNRTWKKLLFFFFCLFIY